MPTENNGSAIVDRLLQIVSAQSATVETKNGPVEDELTADKNSLTAAKSLYGALKRGGDRERGRGGDGRAYAPLRLTIRHQNAILDRLMQIISKQTVTSACGENSRSVEQETSREELKCIEKRQDEVAADKNSIAAARFLIRLQAKYRKYDTEDADIVMLNEHDQKAIVERLMQILNKTSVLVQTKYGPFDDEATADQNAIRAANVLVSYEGLSIERPIAPRLREGEIGRGGDRETEMLLRASVASESRCAGDGVKTPSREGEIGRSGEGSGTAGSSASHDGFKIGESTARCLREGEIGRSGAGETETLTCEAHASESRRAGDGLETRLREGERGRSGEGETEALTRASVDASQLNDRARFCSSSKEEIPPPELRACRDEDTSPDHRSSGAQAGARGQCQIAHGHLEESIAAGEPDSTQSDFEFTAEDVVREALKITLRDRPDLADKIDKQALIERVRAKLDKARRDRGESANVVLAVPRQVNRIAEPVGFSLRTDRNGM